MKERVLILIFSIAISILNLTASEKALSDWTQLASKGDAAFQAGYASEALEYYTEALDNAEQTEDDFLYARTLGKIGNVYSFTGDEKRAISYYLEGYRVAEEMKDETLQFNFATSLVASYCKTGDIENAKLLFQDQRRLAHEQVDLKQFYLLYNQGRIAKAEDKFQMAQFYMEKAADFARSRKMEPNIIYAPYMVMVDMSMERKKYDEARVNLDLAETYARKCSGQYPISRVYLARSQYFEGKNMPDSAEKYASMYRAIEDSMFNQSQFYVAHNKLFDHENSVNKKKINRLISRNNWLTGIVVAIGLLLAVISILLVMLRRRNVKLKDAYSTLLDKIQEQIKADEDKPVLAPALIPVEEPGKNMEIKPETERQGLTMDADSYNALCHRITKAFADTDIISNPDLTLASLADKIGSNSSYVSQIINSVYGKSFRQVVNELRIREACRRMSDVEHYGNHTIQSIYESVGFNSAASFIQAFKKENGMTPSTYQKMIRSRSTDTSDPAIKPGI